VPNLEKYRALTTKQKALVALAVLIDGHDAGQILASGSKTGPGAAYSASWQFAA